jgi:uncharacterized protein
MKRFGVNVADLVQRPGARRREGLRGRLGDLRVVDSAVPADAEVAVDALLEWVTEGILASGSVTAPWVGDCRRCLGPVTGDTRVDFRELFEAQPTEGESYRLAGDVIDMEPLVREALLLDLPLAPVCSPDCRGLCATCGADLNLGACGCPPPTAAARWAALDALRSEPPPAGD